MKKTTSQHETMSVTDILDFNEYALECLKTGKKVEVGDYRLTMRGDAFIKFSVYPSHTQYTCKITDDNIADALADLGYITDSEGAALEIETADGETTVEVDGDTFLSDLGAKETDELLGQILADLADKALGAKGTAAKYFEMSTRIGLIQLRLAA